MKRISLKLKVSLIVAASTLLLTALLMVLSYREYSSVVDEHYNTLAMDIARTAASLVDGDQVDAIDLVASAGVERLSVGDLFRGLLGRLFLQES